MKIRKNSLREKAINNCRSNNCDNLLKVKEIIAKQVKKRIKNSLKEKSKNISKNSNCANDTNTKKFIPAQAIEKIKEIRRLPDYKRIQKILNETERLSVKKKKSLNCITRGKKNSSPLFWNTCTFVIKQIENCIIKNDWTNLTKLLITLCTSSKKCEPFLLKMSLINFLSNPVAQQFEMLEEFLRNCYSCRTEVETEKLLTKLFHIPNNQETK